MILKLSQPQKRILSAMLRYIQQHERRGGDFPEVVRYRRVPLSCL